MITRLHKYWVWLALSLPFFVIALRYWADGLSYGQVIHQSGQWSAATVVAALAATPLRVMVGNAEPVRWLMRHRRALGVASFGYAALHTIVYLERKAQFARIVSEAQRPELLTGWLAMVIFLLLAVTSNNASVRRLGRGWKRLHRFVYLATGLTFVHWILTSVDATPAWLTLGFVVLFQVARVWGRRSANSAS